MSAKTELFTRLKYLDEAITNPALIDNGIAISPHNGSANLLRKGLGIVAFNILEDFIKNKTQETLDNISSAGISFNNLSEKLQVASTWGALNALKFRADMEKKNNGNWQQLIQEESLKIHSTSNGTFELSKFSFLSSGSNVTAKELIDTISAFGISGGWNKLKNVSDSINGGILNLNESYKNASKRRHKSAHTVNFSYEYSWLEGIKKEILAISASFDILLSARVRQVRQNTAIAMNEHNIDDDLNYRFLKEEQLRGINIYKELTDIGGRSRKNWDDLDDAISYLNPRLINNKEFLIILDSSGSLIDWHV